MKWEHFKAFVWLRWRLLYNQQRRAGALNAALTVILGVALLLATIPLFVGLLFWVCTPFPRRSPSI